MKKFPHQPKRRPENALSLNLSIKFQNNIKIRFEIILKIFHELLNGHQNLSTISWRCIKILLVLFALPSKSVTKIFLEWYQNSDCLICNVTKFINKNYKRALKFWQSNLQYLKACQQNSWMGIKILSACPTFKVIKYSSKKIPKNCTKQENLKKKNVML